MTAVAFDTLRLVRALRDKAKMSMEQAEGPADAISEDSKRLGDQG